MNKRILAPAAALAIAVAATGCIGPITDMAPRERTSPQLRSFESCKDLRIELKGNLREEARSHILANEHWLQTSMFFPGMVYAAEDGGDGETVASESDDAGNSRLAGRDFSGTNNQESVADEADFVKTDGYFIYLLNGSNLEILGVPQFG